MNDRQPPGEFTKALVQGVGILALMVVGMLVMRGMISGAIRPAEIIAEIPVWKDTIVGYVPVMLGSAAAVLVSVLAAILATRHGRTWVNAEATARWRYKRRWTDAMTKAMLTGKATKKGTRPPLPVLRGVEIGERADVLTVGMLEGQAPIDWHRRTGTLARAFGATSAYVRTTTSGDAGDIDIVLERGPGHGPTERKALEAPASATLPGLVLDPAQAAAGPRKQVAVRAFSLRIVWAWVRVGDDNERGRHWFGGRLRWDVMDHTGYYAIGGA